MNHRTSAEMHHCAEFARHVLYKVQWRESAQLTVFGLWVRFGCEERCVASDELQSASRLLYQPTLPLLKEAAKLLPWSAANKVRTICFGLDQQRPCSVKEDPMLARG